MVQTPAEDIQRVKADPELGPMAQDIPGLGITYYTYNNGIDPKTLKPFAKCADLKACPTMNKDFRIALTQAIDKKAFIDATFAGIGEPANSMVMPGIPGYQKDLDPYPFDLTAAKASMDKALAAIGVSTAADLGKLKFGFNSGAGHEPRVAFLAEAWRQAFGLETEQIGSDFAIFLQQRTAGEYMLARDGWSADYPHANNQLGLFLCGGGNNDIQWCNKDFDALMAQAAAEPDQAKQVALYEQAQTILVNDAAFLPLRFQLTTYEIQPYLGGINISVNDSQLPGDATLETIYIKEH
jgi:ABC-type transport system substrate-binding protein